MTEDAEFIKNYVPDRLYVNPSTKGAYTSIATEGEVLIDEFDVGERFKIAVTAFYSSEKKDFGTYKIHKLQYRKREGWFLTETISVNGFQLEHIRRLNTVISGLDLRDSTKLRFDLGKIPLTEIAETLNSEEATNLASSLSRSNLLERDFFALGEKRKSLEEFRELLNGRANETSWQDFLERNSWIFGFGLDYVFIDKVGSKFENITTGATYNSPGKRADGLAMARAAINRFVLIEIKSHSTRLLTESSYRRGVWGLSSEVSNGVTQAQKTLFEFTTQNRKVDLKDHDGYSTREHSYSIQPKSILIVGSLAQIKDNDDQVTCFELFRRNLQNPEIITFDELYYRAEYLVAGLSSQQGQ